MIEILLVRHGQTDWNKGGRVMGRRPIPLNRVGRREAETLAQGLKDVKIDRIFTSPVARAIQTARLLTRSRRLKIEMAPELSEVDYGTWVGKTFDEVSREKAYRVYHATPKLAQAPKGEKTADVAKRAISFVENLRKKQKKGSVMVVSHADVIRCILLHYMGLDLNNMQRIQLDNASVSVLRLDKKKDRILSINYFPTIERLFSKNSTDQIAPLPKPKIVAAL